MEVGTTFSKSLFRASKSQHTRGEDTKNTAKNHVAKNAKNLGFRDAATVRAFKCCIKAAFVFTYDLFRPLRSPRPPKACPRPPKVSPKFPQASTKALPLRDGVSKGSAKAPRRLCLLSSSILWFFRNDGISNGFSNVPSGLCFRVFFACSFIFFVHCTKAL